MSKQAGIENTQYEDNFDYEYESRPLKNKVPLTHRTGVKATAFVLAVVTIFVTIASVIGIVFMVDEGVYTNPKEDLKEQAYTNIAYSENFDFLYFLEEKSFSFIKDRVNNSDMIYSVEAISDKGKTLWKYAKEDKRDELYVYSYTREVDFPYDVKINKDTVAEVKISIYQTPTEDGEYSLVSDIINFVYGMKYWIFAIGVLNVFAFIALVIFLLCASGHRKGREEVQPGWGTKIPLEIITAVVVFAVAIVVELVCEGLSEAEVVIITAVASIPLSILLIAWSMSMAVRVKLGEWWKNTLVYYIISLLWKLVKIFFKLVKKACKYLWKLFSNIPLVWKTISVFAVLSLIFLIFGLFSWGETDNFIIFWIIATLIIGLLTTVTAIMMKKLQKAGEALADGDLNYKVDTKLLVGDFKKHGENLNSIAQGMNVAVEQKMKSERMKTELITNVSHDIKTPLTSIVNYTDLISKEPCDNEKITEYSQVLLRQSERLKRLIEDLVEASKATTGNLDVELAPCDLNIFIAQTVGEYEDKLNSKNLQLITSSCEENVSVMADGRRLWRVFDNLMNNVCKYAQSYTRVYLSLEKQENEAVITLKNTSHLPLNISADELLERFVRGDESRNTEGNGLGLSIAGSLTELQKGTLSLTIDGDLFKVTLKFPIL